MEILYDTPIEVTREQYEKLKVVFAEIVAHREENGKYWIKLWDVRFKKELEEYLNV